MHHLFKEIPHKKISDRVFEQIRELIRQGDLLPGDRLPSERELVNLFTVSRSSVREAILKLECLGFLEQRHGEGTYVRSVTELPADGAFAALLERRRFVADLMEIRRLLETWSAAAAAERAGEAEIREIRDCLERMREAEKFGKIGRELHFQFHLAIAKATGNAFLLHVMNCIADSVRQVTDLVEKNLDADPVLFQRFLAQHEEIVEAIEARDTEAARERMSRHLEYAMEKLRGTEDATAEA